MNIQLGERIRELRKRDGRKQEDLANALGVTAQAVSRWEADKCCPDLSLIPAIANYFHITIDYLFGYDFDREQKIKEYVQEAHRSLIQNVDLTKIIRKLRKALEEYPDEHDLLSPLAQALYLKGIEEKDRPNAYLEESARIYDKLVEKNTDHMQALIQVYCQLGEYEKAEQRARSQTPIVKSREILLTSLYQGEKGKKFFGEAILTLLHEMESVMDNAIGWNEELSSSEKGLEISLTMRELYERVFDGNDYGKFHSDLCMLNLRCAKIAIKLRDHERALQYWEAAYVHYAEHSKILDIALGKGTPVEEHYDSPLLENVGFTILPLVVCRPEYLVELMDRFPKKIQTKIRKAPEYKELFESIQDV